MQCTTASSVQDIPQLRLCTGCFRKPCLRFWAMTCFRGVLPVSLLREGPKGAHHCDVFLPQPAAQPGAAVKTMQHGMDHSEQPLPLHASCAGYPLLPSSGWLPADLLGHPACRCHPLHRHCKAWRAPAQLCPLHPVARQERAAQHCLQVLQDVEGSRPGSSEGRAEDEPEVQPGRFMMDGQELDLGFRQQDSLAHRIEALKVFLEKQLGLDTFMQ